MWIFSGIEFEECVLILKNSEIHDFKYSATKKSKYFPKNK